jgi:hypothetical protein
MSKILLIIFVFSQFVFTQVHQDLYNEYQSFHEKKLNKKGVEHQDIISLINNLKNNKLFSVEKVGTSVKEKDIFLIKFGSGTTKVFLWSQMHGDEATATMALFDIFNFFNSSKGNFQSLKESLLNNITFYVIPMLNPDGAEINDRRNALGIDLNRDAVDPQSPESKILKSIFNKIKPDFGFNLHDQYPRYSVGRTNKTAALSFLAPSAGGKDQNEPQLKAIRLIGELFLTLQSFTPGHIAKYSDEHEPRAFGDNFQKWGCATILIESGGWKNDPEKKFIRKLNFITLIKAFESIATKNYESIKLDIYSGIPFNERNHYDLILRNLTLNSYGLSYKADLAINIFGSEIKTASVEDFGNLSTSFGLTEFDLHGYSLEKGETLNLADKNSLDLKKYDYYSKLFEGYTSIIFKEDLPKDEILKIPQMLVKQNRKSNFDFYKTNPQLIIKKDGEIHYVFVKGILYGAKNKIFLTF